MRRTLARTRSILVAVLLTIATVTSVQLATSGPASAATCSWPKTGYQYCSGISHEVLSSKFYKGTSQYYNGNGDHAASIYFNGALKDKLADGECTNLRIIATNSYWPAGNVYTQPDWKVCGAGNEEVIGIYLDQAWVYPGTHVEVQHCYAYNDGANRFCSTFWERTLPS
jgi:hypothetical protein